jgi:hypothetical protein
VLSINALVTSSALFEIWRDQKEQRYLPRTIKLDANADGTISEGRGTEYKVMVSFRAQIVQLMVGDGGANSRHSGLACASRLLRQR